MYNVFIVILKLKTASQNTSIMGRFVKFQGFFNRKKEFVILAIRQQQNLAELIQMINLIYDQVL